MAVIVWRYPEVPKNDRLYQRIVREHPKIGRANFRIASRIGAMARMNLEPYHAHRDPLREPGESRSYITVEQGSRKVDAFVNLNDADGGALGVHWETGALTKAKEAAHGR